MQALTYLPDWHAETWHCTCCACFAHKHLSCDVVRCSGSATSMHLLCSSRPALFIVRVLLPSKSKQ